MKIENRLISWLNTVAEPSQTIVKAFQVQESRVWQKTLWSTYLQRKYSNIIDIYYV